MNKSIVLQEWEGISSTLLQHLHSQTINFFLAYPVVRNYAYSK